MVKGVKKSAVKKVKKVVVKPRAGGLMTESAFWSFIRSCLRSKSRFWPPIQECKKLGRRKSLSNNKRLKWEFQCSECKNWFPEKEIAVDHILEAGSLSCAEDLPGFVNRLFVEVKDLQLLCKNICHAKKTKEYLINKKNNLLI